MKRYYVSALIQGENKEVWLSAMSESVFSMTEAMKLIEKSRNNYNVISAWIDSFDDNDTKKIEYHKCYIGQRFQLKSVEENKTLAETIVTEARVAKLLNKFVNEGILTEDWGKGNAY